MCGTSNHDLPLAAEPAGCSCCSSGETTAAEPGPRPDEAQRATRFHVAGMTCGGCASRVTAELAKLDGVGDVQVGLVPGGLSTITVHGDPLNHGAVRAAVSKAGYEISGMA